MWLWIKHWRDWLMNDLYPSVRIGTQSQAVHVGYEKAGLQLHDAAIPWNAEAVVVDVALRLPLISLRRRADYSLRLSGLDTPIPAEQLRKNENDDRYRITFRLPPLGRSCTATVLWRAKALTELALPWLSRDDFLSGLRLQMATLAVRLGTESVACQTFVANQCKGLIASAVLAGASSLVPLLDLDPHVEFRCERSGHAQRVPIRLATSQLATRQALVAVAPLRYPRRLGVWTAAWKVADRVLATQRIAGISQKQFERSLRISDSRFVLQDAQGTVSLARQLPAGEREGRVGPCFLIASSEAGMAGLCGLRVTAQVPGAIQPPLLLEQQALVTDGPTMVAPGTLEPPELAQVTAFELSVVKGRSLGTLPLCPAPSAAFNAEGGFKPPPDYSWTPAADEELLERLNRLFDGRN